MTRSRLSQDDLSEAEAVQEFAEVLLDAQPVPEALNELEQRIEAHSEVRGYCGNGCKVSGFWQPYPCPTRLFYLAVGEYLSSLVVSGGPGRL
jgi:hypothetical protein